MRCGWRPRRRPTSGPRTSSRARLNIRVFTASEKKNLLVDQVFRDADLDQVDFSWADLRCATFENVSLRGCDFTMAQLGGVRFLRCDLRAATFAGATFGCNRFDESWFVGAIGLSKRQCDYVRDHGGLLLRLVEGSSPRGMDG